MQLSTQGFVQPGVSGGQPYFVVPGTSDQLYTYTVTVSYNKGSGFTPSDVDGNSAIFTTPAGGQLMIAVVASEDSSDNDYNDGVLYFTSYPGG